LSLKTGNKKLAVDVERKLKTQMVEDTFFEKQIGTKKTVAEMMDRYARESVPKLSTTWGNRTCGIITKHLNTYFGQMKLSEVKPADVNAYKSFRLKAGVSGATVNRELAVMSKSFNVAIKEWQWLTDKNPVMMISRERGRERYLSFEEEKRLLEVLPIWIKGVTVFALNSGARIGEILNLLWNDIDLNQRTATFRKTKNGSTRVIPLNSSLCHLLSNQNKARKGDIVFPAPHSGKKIRYQNFIRAFRRSLAKAEIEGFRFHDTRHTAASRLAIAGTDIRKIAEILGHKTLAMAMKYSHLSVDSLRASVELLATSDDGMEERDYNLTTISIAGGS